MALRSDLTFPTKLLLPTEEYMRHDHLKDNVVGHCLIQHLEALKTVFKPIQPLPLVPLTPFPPYIIVYASE